MFIQFHGGVYRSDDAGSRWSEIGAGLPSDFGFPLAVDPADPDSAYVIPLVADMDRVMPDGRLRVYETRDGGDTWAPRGDGLPQQHAYLTVLRQAFQRRAPGPRLSSTLAPQPAGCSARATRGQRGSKSRPGSRRCMRCQPAEADASSSPPRTSTGTAPRRRHTLAQDRMRPSPAERPAIGSATKGRSAAPSR